MKLVYASRKGNVQKLIDRLDVEALKIVDGTETIDGDYVLVTYTDGQGILPPAVETFINAHKEGLKAAAVSGNEERHPDTFCAAADILAEQYGTEILARFNGDGDESVDAAIKAALA
ncbi:MAG: class Ib ribonucleoside-diphosphate reductase assembly flavoprotein NrdI [Eggerthellaceae bacterium]|nr:class Ib ribonucleoside-diphosphate reductase assembly flavoprotein NrdI [Eggerthellaceae bacterium]